jgi:hypothetical protein
MFGKFIAVVGCALGAMVASAVALVSVEHVGQSGKVRLHPFGSEAGRYVELSLAGIEELTPQGLSKGWKTPNIASQSFSWSDPQNVFIDDKSATKVSLNSTMNVGGNSGNNGQITFRFSTLVSENILKVPYGNETINIPQAALKWTIELGPWPWKNNNQDGLLAFSVNMISHKYGQYQVENDVVKLPDGVYMNLESLALVDDQWENIQYTVKESSSKNTITFIFPHYTNNVIYDPVMGIEGGGEESNSPIYRFSPVISMGIVSLLFMFGG